MILRVDSGYVEFEFGLNNKLRIPRKNLNSYKYDELNDSISFGDFTIRKASEISSIQDTPTSNTYNNFSNIAEIDAIIKEIQKGSYVAPDPPAFTSADVGGDSGIGLEDSTLTVVFDSNLDPTKVDGTYTLSTTGAAVTLSNPTIVDNILTLSISRNISYGEVLYFSYVSTGANPLQNVANTAIVETFSNKTVVNYVNAESPKIVSASIGPDSNSKIVINYNEPCFGSLRGGYAVKVNGAVVAVTALSGSGTALHSLTIGYQASRSDVIIIDYSALSGDIVSVSSGVYLESISNVGVSNNIPYSPYIPEAQSLFNVMISQPDDTQKGNLNTLMTTLKSNGILQKADKILVVAGHDQSDSLLNLVGDNGGSQIVGSPAFEQYRGYTNSGLSHIDLLYNPFLNGVNWAKDSATIAIFSRTDASEASYEIGGHTSYNAGDGALISLYNDNFYAAINGNNSNGGPVPDTRGFFIATRTASNRMAFFRDGIKLSETTTVSNTVLNRNMYLLGVNQGGSISNRNTKQIAFVFIGGGLTDGEAIILSDAVATYMSSVGADQYPQPPQVQGVVENLDRGFDLYDMQVINGYQQVVVHPDWTPSSNSSPDGTITRMGPTSGHPVGANGYSLHFAHSDPGPMNSRIQMIPSSTDIKWFEWGTEYWIGTSIYPKNWDQNVSPWAALFDFHAIPINQVWTEPGTGDPILAAASPGGIFNSSTVFGIYGRSLTLQQADGPPPTKGGITDTLWSIPLATCSNKWIDIVLHFIWSPYNDGICQWWVDVGQTGTYTKVIDFTGPNTYKYCYPTATYNNVYLRDPYTNIQIGSYKPNTNTALKEMYLGWFAVGYASKGTNFDTVRPGGYTANYPTFSSGEIGVIGDTTLEVTFSSALAAGNVTGTYTLNSDQSAVTLSSPTIVGGKLQATTSRAIQAGETLSFSYTNSGATPLQDASGNQVQTFASAQSITNNVSGGTPAIEDSHSEVNYTGLLNMSVTGNTWLGQSFTASTSNDLYSIKWYMRRVGSPTGNMVCHLYAADGSNLPTGSALATQTMSQSAVGTSLGLYEFVFSNPLYGLTSTNDYVCVITHDGGMDTLNYVGIGTDSGAGHSGVGSYSSNGISWSVSSSDRIFYIYSVGGTPAAPVVSSMSVENVAPNDFIINLDKACTGTTAGWTPKINAGAATKTGFSGSGTSQFTITVSETVTSGDTLTMDYDSVSGDTQAGGVDLASFTGTSVTNNVSGGSTPTLDDNYPLSNRSATVNLQPTSNVWQAQQYTAVNSGPISSVKFGARRIGNPTGNLVAKIYAVDGSNLPTGSALATSNNLAQSAVGTTEALIELTFTTQYSQTASTKYAVVITHDGGMDASNYITIAVDTTTPTHPGLGSSSSNGTSWSSSSNDRIFEIYTLQ